MTESILASLCLWWPVSASERKNIPELGGGKCLLILLFGCDYTLEWTPLISVWLVWLCCCLLYILYIVCRFFQFSGMVELFIFNLFVPLKKKNKHIVCFQIFYFFLTCLPCTTPSHAKLS